MLLGSVGHIEVQLCEKKKPYAERKSTYSNKQNFHINAPLQFPYHQICKHCAYPNFNAILNTPNK